MALTACFSCLHRFIHAVGHDLNEYYDGDGPAEAAMAEKDHLLDPDAMASSIHAIYRPLERPRLQERLQTVDAPSSDASRTSPLGSPAMPVQDGSSGSADSDDEGDAVQDAQRAARPEQSPEGAPVPAPSDQGAPLATAAERRTNLADKLKEVFGLHEREDVVAEYQAFLFRSVLLQGYLYITTGHICFYAYLRAKEVRAVGLSCSFANARAGPGHQVQLAFQAVTTVEAVLQVLVRAQGRRAAVVPERSGPCLQPAFGCNV
jgi:hypothetical protein